MADAPTTTARTWSAQHRFARISPTKARLVIDMIRHRPVSEALDVLRFSKRRASVLIDQVLRSAMANADEQEADVRRLVVSEARIDPGPYYPRWQPKDRGRAHPIAKRTSHIIVTVRED
jgi:large subunit ribosomal protein L22